MSIVERLTQDIPSLPADPALAYIQCLQLAGYHPVLDGDGDVRFQRDDLTYCIVFDRNDAEFFRMVLPNIWTADTDEKRRRAHAAAGFANARCKVAKVILVKDRVWATAEMFLAAPEQAVPVLERCAKTLAGATMSFWAKVDGE